MEGKSKEAQRWTAERESAEEKGRRQCQDVDWRYLLLTCVASAAAFVAVALCTLLRRTNIHYIISIHNTIYEIRVYLPLSQHFRHASFFLFTICSIRWRTQYTDEPYRTVG